MTKLLFRESMSTLLDASSWEAVNVAATKDDLIQQRAVRHQLGMDARPVWSHPDAHKFPDRAAFVFKRCSSMVKKAIQKSISLPKKAPRALKRRREQAHHDPEVPPQKAALQPKASSSSSAHPAPDHGAHHEQQESQKHRRKK